MTDTSHQMTLSASHLHPTLCSLVFYEHNYNRNSNCIVGSVGASMADPDDESREANEDLKNPKLIVNKIQEVFRSVETDVLPWNRLYVSFRALLHFRKKVQQDHPELRNQKFDAQGDAKPGVKELETLSTMLDFAKWAYEPSHKILRTKLKEIGYNLLRHDAKTEPGRVGHYVAVNPIQKVVIIAVKGTSTVSDALTNLVAQPHEFSLKSGDLSELVANTVVHPKEHDIAGLPARMWCHEGMYVAAQLLFEDTKDLMEDVFLPSGYRLVVTGHSLGSGVASLLGILLHSSVPALAAPDMLRVYGIASPAVVDYETSLACAPFTTSIVNNTDCVPRLSIRTVSSMNEWMHKIDSKLQAKIRPSEWFATLKAARNQENDKELLVSLEEMDDFLKELQANVISPLDESHPLLVPGRVIIMWNRNMGINPPPSNSCSDESSFDTSATHPASNTRPSIGVVVSHGAAEVLRIVEMEESMIEDHSIDSYRTSINALLAP